MNGDDAADQALAAIAKAVAKHGMRDHRPVFVHASWLRPDEIEKVKACGAVPSFLPSGIVPGGDSRAMVCRALSTRPLPSPAGPS